MKFALVLIALIALAPLSSTAQETERAQPLVIEDIQCRGNAATSCSFILGYLYLAAGDRIDEEEIQNAKLRLTTLPDFKKVDIYLERGSARGNARLIIEVIEADPLFTEFGLGTSARGDSLSQLAVARIGHQNVFGTGKLIDFFVAGRVSIDDPVHEGIEAALRYADPHLFDSKKYFMLTDVSYVDARDRNRHGNFSDVEALNAGITLGRRLWDFSYLTLRYGYSPLLHIDSGRWQRSGLFDTDDDDDDEGNRHGINVIYGWNSEDDYYFPTHGSAFHVGFGWYFGTSSEGNALNLQYRKTWQTDSGNLWTIRIGGDPTTERRQSFGEGQLLSFSFARPIASNALGDIKRGRWYIEPGYSSGGFASFGRKVEEFGLKVGVRLESESLGLIDLYFIGSTEHLSGSLPQ